MGYMYFASLGVFYYMYFKILLTYMYAFWFLYELLNTPSLNSHRNLQMISTCLSLLFTHNALSGW